MKIKYWPEKVKSFVTIKFSVTLFFFTLMFSLYAQNPSETLYGEIKNYNNQFLSLYKCYADTLIFVDSVQTDASGNFAFLPYKASQSGLFKVLLKQNKSFFVIYDAKGAGWEGSFTSVFLSDKMGNSVADSLKFNFKKSNKKSKFSNDIFINFQKLQQDINIANYKLMPMMRYFPLTDPFHAKMETEYYKRFKDMDKFVNNILPFDDMPGVKITKAYYQQTVPDWKKPDPWRDSVLAKHYFDFFNPSDSFYLNTNILPEKIDIYLSLRTNKRDDYGQPLFLEKDLADAAKEFLNKINNEKNVNQKNFEFCLKFLLKNFDKEKKEEAFLSLYDTYLKVDGENCEIENDIFKEFREKASQYRGVQIGVQAPNFEIKANTGTLLHSLESDFTLLIFWATWCPHCKEELLNVKKILERHLPLLNEKGIKWKTVAVSLDTDEKQWKNFIKEKNLSSWVHSSELKGWNGTTVRQYNIYATPTMFLLDKAKIIIQKPISTIELERFFEHLP